MILNQEVCYSSGSDLNLANVTILCIFAQHVVFHLDFPLEKDVHQWTSFLVISDHKQGLLVLWVAWEGLDLSIYLGIWMILPNDLLVESIFNHEIVVDKSILDQSSTFDVSWGAFVSEDMKDFVLEFQMIDPFPFIDVEDWNELAMGHSGVVFTVALLSIPTEDLEGFKGRYSALNFLVVYLVPLEVFRGRLSLLELARLLVLVVEG
jgi:hypothetical protein